MRTNRLIYLKIWSLALLLSIISPASPILAQLLVQNASSNQLQSSLAEAILREINLVRTNPLAYADLLENAVLANTSESNSNPQQKEALSGAINFLRNLNPLPELNLSSDLTEIASNLIGENNSTINNTYTAISLSIANQKDLKKIILQLLSNNYNRQTIFTNTVNSTGIACNDSNQKCIITYPLNPQASNLNNIPNNTSSETSEPNLSETQTPETTKERTTPNHINTTEVAATQPYDLLKSGILQDGDTVIPSDGSLYDAYIWEGKQGESLTVTLESEDFDTYLAVQDPEGKIIAENDDFSQGNSNSTLNLTLPVDGVYRLIVNSYDPQGRGKYTITVIKNY
jgi:hypothetical protein